MGVQPQGVSELAFWRDFKISILVILYGSDHFELAAARHCMCVYERENDSLKKTSVLLDSWPQQYQKTNVPSY